MINYNYYKLERIWHDTVSELEMYGKILFIIGGIIIEIYILTGSP